MPSLPSSKGRPGYPGKVKGKELHTYASLMPEGFPPRFETVVSRRAERQLR